MQRGRIVAAVVALFAAGAMPAAAVQGPWSLPATTLSASGELASVPGLALAPNGTATAIWASGPPVSGQPHTVYVADRPPGGAFPAGTAFAGVPNGQLAFIRVGVAADGTTVAAWYQGDQGIVAAIRPPGGAFSAPVDLDGPGVADFGSPSLAVGADGTAVVAWHVEPSGELSRVRAAVRAPGGGFGSAVDLTNGLQRDAQPQVAVAADGTATVVWDTSFDDPSPRVAIRASTRPAGGPFGGPVELGEGNVPDVAVAPDGTTVAIWSGAASVLAAVRPPGGGFGAPAPLPASAAAGPNHAVAAGSDGTIAAVWVDGAAVEVAIRPPGGAFGAAGTVSGSSATTGAARRPQGGSTPTPRSPGIAVGPDGTTTAIWEQPSGSAYVVQAATRPPGGSFGPAVTLSSASSPAGNDPIVAVGPDGHAVATWLELAGSSFAAKAAFTQVAPTGCGDRVQLGRAIVEGALAPTGPGSGIFRVEAPGVAYVGGFLLRPRPGGALVVDTGAGTLAEEGAGVDVVFRDLPFGGDRVVPIAPASIPVNQPSATILFNRAGTLEKTFISLPVSGAATVSWTDGGAATSFEMELEAERLLGSFGTFQGGVANAGAQAPSLKLKARLSNCTGFELTGAEVAAAELSFIPLALQVPRKLGIKNLLLKYERANGIDTWTGQGEIILPITRQPPVQGSAAAAPDLSVGGRVVVRDGELASIGLAVSGINKEIGYKLFLQRIAGDVVMEPDFGGSLAIEATLGPAVVRNGRPNSLIKYEGALKLFQSAATDCPAGPNPIALVGNASIPIVEELGAGSVKLTDRACIYATSLAIEKTMGVEATLGEVVNGSIPRPVATFRSTMRGFASTSGIELEGAATLTIPVVGPLGGRALISNRAIAACAQISFFSGGVVHRWTDTGTQTFTGCDLSPWRVGIPTGPRRLLGGDGRTRTVQVPAGLPFVGLYADGAESPPAIEVTAPGGARFTSDGVQATIQRDVVLVPVAAERRTYAFVRAPAAGAWRVTALGTQALGPFARASGLPKPRVEGTVTGRGATRTLRYAVLPIPGQKVVFHERTADGITRVVGTAKGARGTISFRPQSTGQRARIDAIVTQDGLPRAILRVASFTARLSAVVRLEATRTALGLAMSWQRDPRATGYRVEVHAGGKRVARVETATPRLRLTSVPAGRLRVTVVALPPTGPASPAAAVVVSPR